MSYTTLTSDPTSTSSKAARIYSDLVVKFTNALTNNPAPYLPVGITLNVNFASIDSCPDASSYKFVLTRIQPNIIGNDVTTCGRSRLPAESNAIKQGCIATVSVMSALTKLDVSAHTQGVVMARLKSILSCP